ncbi:UbiA family prenyltransferase [Psychroflexus halocasei]|uniref:UbiA prenyltransferase family protein n=1 Tax=Psychroflexus halocasei TaxID=908615 RepID=A0A1H3VEN0_9FLAO|nr:UbiA family prenyltransferase [Psychroflexus halocasei]SDZ72648.1 hypothetical protein SAMN05421540_1011 [Psychroflexus halocasei]
MNYLKNIFDFYINSSTHVALAIASFTVLTFIDLKIKIDYHLISFVFAASVTAYNFVKYASIAGFRDVKPTMRLKVILVYSFLIFLYLIYSLFFLNFTTLLVGFVLVLLTLLYTLPLLPGFHNLRDLGGLKIFIIAIVWTVCTVLLPVAASDASFTLSPQLIAYFVIRFLWVLILMIPFEIRDLKDDAMHLNTIPQLIGVRGAKLTGFFFITISFVLFHFFHPDFKRLPFLLMSALSTVLLFFSTEKRSLYYTSFLVEAVPILWLLNYFIF